MKPLARSYSSQKGVVLFIALIALVAMTLGAIALYRSVDSATAISGNISYRQQGIALTNRASEEARTWLLAQTGMGALDNNIPGEGYFASMAGVDMLTFDWSQAKTTANPPSGYTLSYVIHRLCQATGPVDPGTNPCVTATVSASAVRSVGDRAEGEGSSDASATTITPYYRITVRALGPRNSESMSQVLMY